MGHPGVLGRILGFDKPVLYAWVGKGIVWPPREGCDALDRLHSSRAAMCIDSVFRQLTIRTGAKLRDVRIISYNNVHTHRVTSYLLFTKRSRQLVIKRRRDCSGTRGQASKAWVLNVIIIAKRYNLFSFKRRPPP